MVKPRVAITVGDPAGIGPEIAAPAVADVPRTLTRESLEATIDLTARALPRFGFPAPRIAVAGLNPHAGEHGLFGLEDETTLRPAVVACRARGVDVSGPFPADTVFVRA